MTEQLFVYGTLLEPAIQKRVFGRITSGQPDKLAGYKKDCVWLAGNEYPIIRPKAGGIIEGAVLSVTLAELALIDQYEGDAYQRHKVRLVSGQQAWVYRA
jgi:gamma-glutamylcyclotransferase (GGCT)/AIG2-like uncharacterized protein YtfP